MFSIAPNCDNDNCNTIMTHINLARHSDGRKAHIFICPKCQRKATITLEYGDDLKMMLPAYEPKTTPALECGKTTASGGACNRYCNHIGPCCVLDKHGHQI